MEKEIYNYLEKKLSGIVDNLNNNLNWLDSLRKKEYHALIPGLEEFNGHEELIQIISDTFTLRKQRGGSSIIASIKKGGNGGLDGAIYSENKKVKRLSRETLHSFAHRYNLPTGDLL